MAEPSTVPALMWIIILVLVGVVGTLTTFIVKLLRQIQRLNDERVKITQEQITMLRELQGEVKK